MNQRPPDSRSSSQDRSIPQQNSDASAEARTERVIEDEVAALTGRGPRYIEKGSREYRFTMLALFSAGFATFALLYCVQPLMPILSSAFAINAAQSSLVLSVATATLALGLLITGSLSDALGRKNIMSLALVSAAIFTLLTALMPSWPLILLSRALVGLSLSGLAAVAMTYLSEELSPRALGVSMGIYISGNAIGGMSGRVISGVLVDFLPWRVVMLILGGMALLAALAFLRWLPASRNFEARPFSLRGLLSGTRLHFKDPGLPWLFLEGFLLMGAFVTMFNYIGYRLLDAPYFYSQALVGLISVVYLCGIYSSAWGGAMADKHGHRNVFWGFVLLLVAGALLTLFNAIVLIVAGIALLTFGFFAAHSTASSWVGRRASVARGQAASLYLFFYYLGSSVAGTSGGMFWHMAGWPGVVGFIVLLLVAALAIAWFRLHRLTPLHTYTS
ncbi:MFS transporter [Carnimonas nigrificans]|uniref:MFS transporter n=1 Tax=Carnimonas nigrificans TaxID=64323 RepID=UPI0004BC1E5D|nr:MFS transporter [Carnimonas nigrificans]